MATLDTYGYAPAALSAAQTGNGASTNIALRSFGNREPGGGAVLITPTYGASATVKVDIQGSVDGVHFFNVPYALTATPRTFVLSQITIAPVAAVAISAATAAASVATFTTAAHTFVVGDQVIVAGVTPAGYNGTWTVLTVADTTHFTANIGTTPGAGTVFGTAIVGTPFNPFTYLLQEFIYYRYLQLLYSANTATTLTATAYL